MRATLYDFTKKGTLTPGNSVIILNYIFKTEPSEGIVITKNSKVMKTASVEVSASLQTEAELIANPPQAKPLPIKQVKGSPVKSLVTVKGTVISVSIYHYIFVCD